MANTIKEKELKTDWDATTAADSTKAIGHVKNLIAEEGSNVSRRERQGID